MLTEEEARSIVDRILKASRAPEVSVRLTSHQNCNTRFANNDVTTAGFTSDLSVHIEVRQDRKTGIASTTETSDDALRRTVARAEELAAVALPDPEYVEPLGPQSYPKIAGYDEASANARSAELLPAMRTTVESAEAQKLKSFGFFEADTTADAIANKNGLFGYHRATSADYSVTARTLDGSGSGWAESQAPRLSGVQAKRVSEAALKKALDSQNPRNLDPGKYTVILEPAALEEMLNFMFLSFGARAADESRSFLSKKGGGTLLGEKLFGENVTLKSDPFDERMPGIPWGASGPPWADFRGGEWLPAEKTVWVEKGIVKNMSCGRYWARKSNRRPVAYPSGIVMEGGNSSLDDLIASTDRGLLITHFWYVRFLQEQTMQLTGLTRDGVFYIEKGKILYPVNNFRFNQSVVDTLNNAEAMTPAAPVTSSILPTVKVRDFNMSSRSDAV
jgi:predicted Zn-dependent protease